MSKEQHTSPVRVRFAPSPTGSLHLGGLRTALFDWLYARQTGGQFILRIEDTDQKRFDPHSLDNLTDSLRWLGLDWDEGPDVGGPFGPYVQSERKEIYLAYAEQLIEQGHAYRCYCSPEELRELREEQRRRRVPFGQIHPCRHLGAEERADREARGESSVVSFAAPLEGATTVEDLIRGAVTVQNKEIRDPVLLKSDNMPTYHLAMVVDDHLMEISHVLRGQEWLPSAPLHKLLFDAFGWQMPVLLHLPVILDPSGKGKMSKRKKVVDGVEYLALVQDFIDAGYLPDAMFNFLTNVGWNYDAEQEIFSREEAVARFRLEEINPAPAALPYDKLDWINGIYIRQLTPEALKEQLIPFLSRDLGIDPRTLDESGKLDILVPLIQERIKRLSEAAWWIEWAFVPAEKITYEDPALLLGRKLDSSASATVLRRGLGILADIEPFDGETIQQAFREAADAMEIKAGSFFGPFRGAITGRKVSPPLFESMEALGRQEVLQRVEQAAGFLEQVTISA